MFPTDSSFGALALEYCGHVAPLLASRSVLVQSGWLLGPLRLLRPHLLAGRTVDALRRVSDSWLAAAVAAAPGKGANQDDLRRLGLEMKRLFKIPLLRDLTLRASNAMYTSVAASASATAKPPRCVREYLLRAERGDDGAKLQFQTRWAMVRLLRAIGIPRHAIQRAFLSADGMRTWYPNPRVRESEIKQRKATLGMAFSNPLNDQRVSCQTFSRYGLCPFEGNVGACCVAQTGEPGRVVGVWSPFQVANLGRPRVTVELEQSHSGLALVDNLYLVATPPARLYHASVSQL
jgi:hypothetical protein